MRGPYVKIFVDVSIFWHMRNLAHDDFIIQNSHIFVKSYSMMLVMVSNFNVVSNSIIIHACLKCLSNFDVIIQKSHIFVKSYSMTLIMVSNCCPFNVVSNGISYMHAWNAYQIFKNGHLSKWWRHHYHLRCAPPHYHIRMSVNIV